MCLQLKSFENTVGKGEIARYECFLTVMRTSSHFHQNQNCRLQTLSIWKSLKFVVWERIKSLFYMKNDLIRDFGDFYVNFCIAT